VLVDGSEAGVEAAGAGTPNENVGRVVAAVVVDGVGAALAEGAPNENPPVTGAGSEIDVEGAACVATGAPAKEKTGIAGVAVVDAGTEPVDAGKAPKIGTAGAAVDGAVEAGSVVNTGAEPGNENVGLGASDVTGTGATESGAETVAGAAGLAPKLNVGSVVDGIEETGVVVAAVGAVSLPGRVNENEGAGVVATGASGFFGSVADPKLRVGIVGFAAGDTVVSFNLGTAKEKYGTGAGVEGSWVTLVALVVSLRGSVSGFGSPKDRAGTDGSFDGETEDFGVVVVCEGRLNENAGGAPVFGVDASVS
jgi:hypothetical protein